ncbi:TPA: lysozyme [Enterobacter soli]|uniref:Lysozyme n=1 Tax=Enterobacter soli TaxID=885040 RepID=A0AAW8HCF3_9ENTR|nr:lysozyme [Enterobacter soli]MDQ2258669.1 lysozyme [Enterobacter soli]MDQ2338746.1 lysozyme [Enterobacter soli]HEE9789893.1 lysozyme [Enterobacter soli]
MICRSLMISSSGIELIKHYQGLSLEKYCDESGLWIIGYGHVIGPKETTAAFITLVQAEQLLFDDIQQCEDVLRENITRPLTQEKHDALVSLIFSCGVKDCLNTGIIQEVARGNNAQATSIWRNALMLNDKKINSLALQRQAECALFESE